MSALNLKVMGNICCLSLSVLVLYGCLPLMDVGEAQRFNDWLPPEIVIESPSEGTLCANIVVVTGRVTDLATKRGDKGQVRSLFYEVEGRFVSGTAELLPDNRFIFDFRTANLDNDFILLLTAVDWNDNRTTQPYALSRDPGNGIPSFTAIPGNKQVTLQWEPVPHTVDYTLYYTSGKSLPSENYGQKVAGIKTSPLVLDPLENGQIYSFRLIANPQPDWPESRSDYIFALPLSPRTLAPQVTGRYKAIEVCWNPLPQLDAFEVWRAEKKDGVFVNISGKVTGNYFLDKEVKEGNWYYYKIYPAFENTAPHTQIALPSDANSAEPAVLFDKPDIAQSVYTNGTAMEITISGHYAYVAAAEGGLQILSIRNPCPSAPVREVSLDRPARDVAVSGHFAYVAAEESGLQIVDISHPEMAKVVHSVDTQGMATMVEVAGDYAFVGVSGDADIRVIDIRNPFEARQHCSIDVEGEVTRFALADRYAYFAIRGSGLHVFDVSSPEAIVWRGMINMQEEVCDLKIASPYAYLIDKSKAFTILDISVPEDINSLYFFHLPYVGRRIAISGSYAYVTTGEHGLYFINLNNPFNAFISNSVMTPGLATGVAAYGPTAYVADWNAVRIIKTGDLSAAELAAAALQNEGLAKKVVVAGSYAYAVLLDGGLRIIDLSSLHGISNPYTVPNLGSAEDAFVSGDFAYIAAGQEGLKIIDISEPLTAQVIKTVPGYFVGISVSGDFAYALEGSSLQIIDISEPPFAAKVSAFAKLPQIGCQIKVKGGYAYLANGYFGLTILNIQNPLNPGPFTTVDTPGFVHELEIRGTTAYVADGECGLQIIDISNPANPGIVNTIPTSACATGVKVSGFYALVTDPTLSAQLVDISNQLDARVVNALNYSAAALTAEISGNYLFLACRYDGVRVIRLFPE